MAVARLDLLLLLGGLGFHLSHSIVLLKLVASLAVKENLGLLHLRSSVFINDVPSLEALIRFEIALLVIALLHLDNLLLRLLACMVAGLSSTKIARRRL